MMPPVFSVLSSSAAVKSLIGSPPNMRAFADEAVQGVARPYVVYQLITGLPVNYISQLPDTDNARVQIDIYADTESSREQVYLAVRDAVEPHAHIVGSGMSRDENTKAYRCMIDAEFFTPR